MNTRVFKEPLGFIRVIEFPMAILAFATTAGYKATTTISSFTCPAGGSTANSYAVDWGYSFGLNSLPTPADICNPVVGNSRYLFSSGAVSQSQFFVFTGVVAFFYILAILGVYLLMWPRYENDGRFALGDFVATALLAFFWFVSSCAWASGLNTVKSVTDPAIVYERLISKSEGTAPCNAFNGTTPAPNICNVSHSNYASLNVSVIAGFACFGLWLANLWFIYKETPWYKARAAMTTPSTGPGVGTSGSMPSGGNTFR